MLSTTAVLPTGTNNEPGKPPTSSAKIQDAAAIAALYVTKHKNQEVHGPQSPNNRQPLSSPGAASSLKYANPQDLPSFPSSGLRKDDSAAGVAANLGWANQKPFEHWKPDPSSSASAAAMMAKDYKMAPLWQPQQSTSGAKAALSAHKDGGKVEIWRPDPNSAWGNSAATQAFKKFDAGALSPVTDYGYTALGRQGSLMAATGAMSQGRKRAESTPIAPKRATYPDEANAVANALSAATSATSAHKPQKRGDISSEGGSVPYTNMAREMYTSHPPVVPEVEEKNREDTLRASAVAMARQMYNYQQKQIDAASSAPNGDTTSSAQHGAAAAHRRQPSSSATDDEVNPMRFNNLQEAAQKLAQERLGRLQNEHTRARDYRDYYGSSPSPQSRLSIRRMTRHRAASDGTLDEDREQSNKIRAQMSLFSSNLSQVDAKKRQQDRAALIAAAQRNVTKSLHGMDEKVFADTGKVSPSLLNEWEVKAHAAAQAKSETRMENYGKVNLGGGKFINQSAVDLVAARNVQPVLDEINEKAAAERERQAALKLEQETAQRTAAEKKAKEKESKETQKKEKQQEKEDERLRKQEEKRAAKDKRKSGTATVVEAEPDETATATAEATTVASEEPSTIAERRENSTQPKHIRTSIEDQENSGMPQSADATNVQESSTSPTSPDGSKVKNWLKTKFSRRMSKGQKPASGGEVEKDADKGSEKAFIGGAALTGASVENRTPSLGVYSASIPSSSKDEEPKPNVEPEVEEEEVSEDGDRVGRPARRDSEVSALSSEHQEENLDDYDAEDDNFQEARDNFDEHLAPPPTFPVAKSSSPSRQTKFTEAID